MHNPLKIKFFKVISTLNIKQMKDDEKWWWCLFDVVLPSEKTQWDE